MKIAVDLIVLTCLLYYLYKGTKRGFLLSFLGVLSIVCSYVGAYALSEPLAAGFEAAYESNPIGTRILAGGAIFVLIAVAFSLVQFIAGRFMTKTREDGKRHIPLSPASRTLGGLISIGVAVILLTVLWWVYDAMRASAWTKGLPDLDETIFATTSQTVVKGIASLALKGKLQPEQASFAAELISAPGDAVKDARELLDDPTMKALFESLAFREDFLSGDEKRVIQNPEFGALFKTDSTMERMVKMGLVNKEKEPEKLKKALGRQLARAGDRLSGILEDPEIQKMVEELQQEEALQDGDWKTLVFDKRIRDIAARVLKPAEEKKESEPTEYAE